MKIMFLTIALMGAFALVSFGIDYAITTSRVVKNQQAWDEYSKDMTEEQKLDKYLPFCENQRVRYGWTSYYFPKIF